MGDFLNQWGAFAQLQGGGNMWGRAGTGFNPVAGPGWDAGSLPQATGYTGSQLSGSGIMPAASHQASGLNPGQTYSGMPMPSMDYLSGASTSLSGGGAGQAAWHHSPQRQASEMPPFPSNGGYGAAIQHTTTQGQGWQQPDPSLQSLPKAVVDKLQSYPPEFQKIYMQRLDAMVKSKQQQQKSQQEQQRAPQLPPVGVGGVGMAAQGFQSPSMGKASILQVPGMGGEQEFSQAGGNLWLDSQQQASRQQHQTDTQQTSQHQLVWQHVSPSRQEQHASPSIAQPPFAEQLRQQQQSPVVPQPSATQGEGSLQMGMPALFEAAEARTKKLRQALDTLLAKPLPAPSFQGEEGNHADLRESPQRDVRQLEGLEDAGRTPPESHKPNGEQNQSEGAEWVTKEVGGSEAFDPEDPELLEPPKQPQQKRRRRCFSSISAEPNLKVVCTRDAASKMGWDTCSAQQKASGSAILKWAFGNQVPRAWA